MVRGRGQKRDFLAERAVGGISIAVPVAGSEWLAERRQFIASGPAAAMTRTRSVTAT